MEKGITIFNKKPICVSPKYLLYKENAVVSVAALGLASEFVPKSRIACCCCCCTSCLDDWCPPDRVLRRFNFGKALMFPDGEDDTFRLSWVLELLEKDKE